MPIKNSEEEATLKNLGFETDLFLLPVEQILDKEYFII